MLGSALSASVPVLHPTEASNRIVNFFTFSSNTTISIFATISWNVPKDKAGAEKYPYSNELNEAGNLWVEIKESSTTIVVVGKLAEENIQGLLPYFKVYTFNTTWTTVLTRRYFISSSVSPCLFGQFCV